MELTKRRNLSVLGIAAVAMFGLAACSTGDEATTAPSAEDMTTQTSEGAAPEASAEDMDPAANLVGAGCADYAEQVPDGDGSVAGMALDPVATAASNNPLLTQLTASVSGQLNPDVDLVDTLNGGEFTIFAPVDSAFEALDAATVDALKSDADLLSGILTYHVVEGRILPSDLEGTTQTTVQGGDVEITGSGDELKVNDANVICGGVQTANATVYLIDGILMPPAQ